MTHIRLLADMNISPKTVDALRQQGWDIIRVSQVLPMDAYKSVLAPTYAIIGAAGEMHRILGPGRFLELVYEEALAHEFNPRGVPYERQAKLTMRYKEIIAGLAGGGCGDRGEPGGRRHAGD